MTEHEFDCDVRVADGKTEIAISGTQEAAVVVRSESGERVYLPPEGFDADADLDSPYQAARSDSPYQSVDSDSPYQSARDDSPYQSIRRGPGVTKTADGFTIVHGEEVTEYSVYR
ncbi:hypothetical protein SAMN04487949_2477 [Halogranum gelatinilyticum]|uniref:Uncharacterized protein n=1 Tax=Halogranum gelatinilyticum TaxID=660521 RepID=A0A1G9VR99_9EURY|nr:hypothetical protein [Halogranum gelatinilyticum]SDM74718.1 hypothetical protein SAMN04487949_2477 [Halogranum gelatinilyticum]